MIAPERDRFDEAIDEAARQLVTGTVPPTVAESISRTLAAGRPRRRGMGWQMSLAAASFMVLTAAVAFIWVRGERASGDTRVPISAGTQPPKSTGPPEAGAGGVISRTVLAPGHVVNRGPLPDPVRVAAISVAPITMPVIQVMPFELARVDVMRVEVPTVEITSQQEGGVR
jgi:hypothetical protein